MQKLEPNRATPAASSFSLILEDIVNHVLANVAPPVPHRAVATAG
jgi:hypothetical protein